MDEQKGGGTLNLSKKKLKKERKNNKDLINICEKFKIMGWRKSFIEKYRRENIDVVFEGEVDKYWLKCAIDKAYIENENTSTSFQDLLYNIGLKKSVVNYLWNVVIEPIYDTCYSKEQLFHIAIEHVFGETKPLFGNKPYYLNLTKENEWYDHKESNGFMMNYNGFAGIESIIRDLDYKRRDESQSSNDKFYLFHCTAWRHAKSIISGGVKFFRGRECLDFGIDPGFYMTKDIQVALEWGEKKKGDWSNEIAILIFELSHNKLSNYKVKVFENANKEWKNLVRSSRKCQDEKNILDSFDFVYGPMCKNPMDVSNDCEMPVPFQNRFQLVSKNRESDALLNKNYIGCIWKKNNKFN
jgi:hypothetical protein